MADLDPELVERVIRWCAEAGRQTGAAEIRAALSPLSWDAILNVRALLADPPPARPLGPAALADLARGTPADVAAEREREGRYRAELDLEEPADAAAAAEAPSPAPSTTARPKTSRKGPRRPAAPVVHRKRDRPVPAAPSAPPAPPFERLLDPEGRAVLERLLRENGARRAILVAELGRWRRADGAAPTEADLDALLDHHGMARAFAHRERDELLHALRAARGDRSAAAAAVGLDGAGFQAALDRLGATGEAERLREERRADLRARPTIAERCRLVANEAERLADLGVLEEFEADLRARLGEHLRALQSGAPGALAMAFARSVSLDRAQVEALAQRLGLDLGPARSSHPGAGGRPPRPRPTSWRTSEDRPFRAGAPRPPGPRTAGARPPGPRGADTRDRGPRPPRPGDAPPRGGPRTSGPRAGAPRAGGPRTSGPHTGGPRTAGPRSSGARTAGPRTSGPRPGGPRPGGPRPGAPRTTGPRTSGPRAGGPPGGRPPRGGGRRPAGPGRRGPRPGK